ncbi:MAG: D-2-hydroxyacid dehydrogenase [Actinomycetota bacterium]|nr:D-2-hydroxyacid dehydrogenase [Actinomycetota bacterium]MDA3014385.1 D-2-hydroxyacid dehydrogenase [Actinomycetota bacterium]MDA3028571.1 D-2-hydroxyacid dehydrogenase [Actinomycetota bacterium]
MNDVLFLTDTVARRRGAEIRQAAPAMELLELTGETLPDQADLDRITHAFFSADAWPDRGTLFLKACMSAPNLRWMHNFSAGSDAPVFARFAERGVSLGFTPGGSAPSIAQTVMLMVLALVRGLPELIDAQRRRSWEPAVTRDLGDLTIGILGMGSIGAETARLITPTGARVIGIRRTPTGDEPCETWPEDRRDELLALADVVISSMPLTDTTRRSISAREFELMRAGSIFVNVGRGECVVEADLIAALQSGHLAGAGLDVFAVEPLPAESPLWSMDRVIVSPHASGLTERSTRRAEDAFLEQLARTV